MDEEKTLFPEENNVTDTPTTDTQLTEHTDPTVAEEQSGTGAKTEQKHRKFKPWQIKVILVACFAATFFAGFGCGQINTVSKETFYKVADYTEELIAENAKYAERLAQYEPTETPTETVDSSSFSVVPNVTEISYEFINASYFAGCLNDGTFRCGTDFEPGDYYVMALFSGASDYNVSSDPNDFSWSNYKTIYKISPKDGQYVKLTYNAILVPVNMIDESNWNQYGVFLVGKDIPAGDYKLEPITNQYSSSFINISGIGGACQISDHHPADSSSECYSGIENQTYITVKNGQYVSINNIHMTLVQ